MGSEQAWGARGVRVGWAWGSRGMGPSLDAEGSRRLPSTLGLFFRRTPSSPTWALRCTSLRPRGRVLSPRSRSAPRVGA